MVTCGALQGVVGSHSNAHINTYHRVQFLDASHAAVHNLAIVIPGADREAKGVIDLVKLGCQFSLHGLQHVLIVVGRRVAKVGKKKVEQESC